MIGLQNKIAQLQLVNDVLNHCIENIIMLSKCRQQQAVKCLDTHFEKSGELVGHFTHWWVLNNTQLLCML